ncbi:hypothetical protein [Paremcibacter congregatus]|uniref:Uncharacterized protein n=1 Tax=Paremcibacter congregatus TaxID=2043170 RepID=A0A2G4YS00_9PROT|nr:hypothetical protein [Paremcibacter congregatus]PHZ85091.1 hypothetical protein CRD36_08595 [Paremcibacter congregatus]QDE27959.1 hypothetical protein FIV45_12100 [Paremcibacter congregatus]
MRNITTAFFLVLSVFVCVSGGAHSAGLSHSQKTIFEPLQFNLDHFNHLYAPLEINGTKMAVVNIYSEYPDYHFAIEPAEGFACVDDVARAIVMLAGYLKTHPNKAILKKMKMLIEFILYMQNDNGYFNNFIWHDLSINTGYKTSVAEMNWWSFRALWSLEVAYGLVSSDVDLVNRIAASIDRLMVNLKRDLPLGEQIAEIKNTIWVASWLPQKFAADQAAVAIMGLLPHYVRQKDGRVLDMINALAKGIMQMQKGGKGVYPYGMFLSWENEWHAWGNSQAYALLLAGQQLKHPEYIESALREVDYFYPYLLKNGLVESLSIRRDEAGYSEIHKRHFPQIAYGIRPMVYAAAEAYQATQDKKYLVLQAKLTSWFTGDNIARRAMYDQATGRTYDAINSAVKINMNSGAESTIEGLLVLQK